MAEFVGGLLFVLLFWALFGAYDYGRGARAEGAKEGLKFIGAGLALFGVPILLLGLLLTFANC